MCFGYNDETQVRETAQGQRDIDSEGQRVFDFLVVARQSSISVINAGRELSFS
jgi:hypothetical protein